ncbi:MAG TPA: glutathione S-transferase family protein [Micropepsaceae bacterium]|nr:glutathione S-transferase family protein [Micropepsaceae bacterium]
MALKIYAFPPSPRSFKVLWAAHQLGVDYELQFVDLSKGDQRKPGYSALNPNARAPVVDDNGYLLWESNAIVEYFASLKPASGALPQDTRARLAITKWLYWESAHWDQACAILTFQRVVKRFFSMGEPDAAEIARGNQIFERAGQVLDSELSKHRYVAGDQFTAADLSVGADMCVAEMAEYPIAAFDGIRRWYDELRSMPSWQKTIAMQRPPGS